MKVNPKEVDKLQAAKTCHEVMRIYNAFMLKEPGKRPWITTSKEEKQRYVDGIKHFLENPENAPSDLHSNWIKQKKADGWTYGERRSNKEKTHPHMCPYDKLPTSVQVKHEIFAAIIRSFQ